MKNERGTVERSEGEEEHREKMTGEKIWILKKNLHQGFYFVLTFCF